MFSRRDVIRALAAAGGSVALHFSLARRWLAASSLAGAGTCSHGELYEGFLLLGADDPTPDCVVPPRLSRPNLCGVGEAGMVRSAIMASTRHFTSAQALALASTFAIYALEPPPAALGLADAVMLYHPSGAEYQAGLLYRRSATGTDGDVTLWANPVIARPYPVRPTPADTEDWHGGVALEKVAFLPTPGVFCDESPLGFESMWIDAGVMYRLVDQLSVDRSDAERLASSLKRLP